MANWYVKRVGNYEERISCSEMGKMHGQLESNQQTATSCVASAVGPLTKEITGYANGGVGTSPISNHQLSLFASRKMLTLPNESASNLNWRAIHCISPCRLKSANKSQVDTRSIVTQSDRFGRLATGQWSLKCHRRFTLPLARKTYIL